MAEDELIGCLVQVAMSGGVHPGYLERYHGIVVEADEASVILRLPNGDNLFLPQEWIRELVVVERPPTPGGNLLRAAEEPEADRLVRPVPQVPARREQLLRPRSARREE